MRSSSLEPFRGFLLGLDRMSIACRVAALLAGLSLFAAPRPAEALFHLAVIDEVMTSYDGNPSVQFVEIKTLAAGQNLVANSVLGVFDANGNFVQDVLVVPGNVPNGGAGVRWIMGTSEFQSASGLVPDFVIGADLPNAGGMVCWGAPGIAPPANTSWDRTNFANWVDCLAYGTYVGPGNVRIGRPTTLDAEGHSLMRVSDTDDNATDFTCVDAANPTNNAGAAASLDRTARCTGLPLNDPIPSAIPMGAIAVPLTPIAAGITAPNWGTHAGDGSNRLFVSDQSGQIYAIHLGTHDRTVFLDVSSRLVPLGIAGPGTYDERGLLGLAFHPDYANNGRLFTHTSEPVSGPADFGVPLPLGVNPNHQSVVTEWQVHEPADPAAVVDPLSAREILRVDQPQFNHDGGGLAFGPDGMLYISFGDGGGADDQGDGHGGGGNGQDPSNVLGTLLRIDVDGNNSLNGQYGVPGDNPFVGQQGFVDEIFAYGFRNPFRFSFDSGTGDLIVGDVGQNGIEEIDLCVAGGNYGWNDKEGSFFFDPDGSANGFVTDVAPGVPPGLIDPIAEYDHDEGIAVIGGFVYRGTRVPELTGRYVFGDYTGRLFYLDESSQIRELALGAPLGRALLGFGQDANGEIYVLANGTGIPFGDTGEVLLVPEPGQVVSVLTAVASIALLLRRHRRRFHWSTR